MHRSTAPDSHESFDPGGFIGSPFASVHSSSSRPLTGAHLRQSVSDEPRHRNDTVMVTLQSADNDPVPDLHRVVNQADATAQQVKVSDPQTRQLTPPDTGIGQPQHDLGMLRLAGQRAHLLVREVLARTLNPGRELQFVAERVRGYPPISHSVIEDARQHRQARLDHLSFQSDTFTAAGRRVRRQLRDPRLHIGGLNVRDTRLAPPRQDVHPPRRLSRPLRRRLGVRCLPLQPTDAESAIVTRPSDGATYAPDALLTSTVFANS
jgi:hypothetical protein